MERGSLIWPLWHRNKGISKVKISYTPQLVEWKPVFAIDLYSRQVQIINVNHTLIFTLGTFKILIITLAEMSLAISKFQAVPQDHCPTTLERFVLDNNIIDASLRKGFLTGINGTMEHIFSVSAIVQNALQHSLPLAMTFLDLENVFGSISH